MKTLVLAVLATVAVVACTTANKETPSLTVDEVDQGLQSKTLVAVDCNGNKIRKAKGVLPGAILISDADRYPESELPDDKSTRLVFYCKDDG